MGSKEGERRITMFMVTSDMVPLDDIEGEDKEETARLISMAQSAQQYLQSFDWCCGIEEAYLGFGIGDVISVFLFKIIPTNEVDEWLWVVNGDIPPAYFVTDRAPDPLSAIKVYCELMEEWIKAVQEGSQFNNVFPVGAPADEEHTNMLATRIQLIKSEIIPNISN